MGFLIKRLKTPYGVEFNDVYFKLNRISYNDENRELYFAGAFYISQEAREQGLQPIENGILCEVIPLENKTVNMFEHVYNVIRDKANEITSLTQEEVLAHNNKVTEASAMNDGPITGLLNPNYALFKDAIDC